MLTHSSFLQTMSQRRDPVIIMSEILSCAARGVRKSEMMYKVGLSSAQIKKYLLLLIDSELIAVYDHDEKATYKTTAKGKNFLETFDTITRLLDQYTAHAG
jgi:predicted transcriptional regulator